MPLMEESESSDAVSPGSSNIPKKSKVQWRITCVSPAGIFWKKSPCAPGSETTLIPSGDCTVEFETPLGMGLERKTPSRSNGVMREITTEKFFEDSSRTVLKTDIP